MHLLKKLVHAYWWMMYNSYRFKKNNVLTTIISRNLCKFFSALMINHAVHLYSILYSYILYTYIYIHPFFPQNMTIKMRSMLYSDTGSNPDFGLSIILFGHWLYFLSLHFPIMGTPKRLVSSVFSLKLQIPKYYHFL